MKVLVTGGAGFIGSHLCEKLIEEHEVICIDNLSLGRKENVAHLRSKKNFTFHQVEILDRKEFENIFRMYHFDAVFHMAANSDISKGDPENDFKNTLSTTLVVLEKCRVRNIKQFIFASSGSIYGETKERFKEDHGPLFPISHYGASKLASEAFISSYCAMYGIQSFICRLPNVVGERLTHGAVYDFINWLLKTPGILRVLGDGNQTKTYIYVKDCVDAIIHIWKNAKGSLNYFNIGGKGQTSVKEIAEMVVKAMGTDTKIVYAGGERGWKGDCPYYDCDTKKLKDLGFEIRRTSNQAVEMAIKKQLK